MEATNTENLVEEELTVENVKAIELCVEINSELEAADRNETTSEEFLEKTLDRFKEALDLEPECLEAHIGIVYFLLPTLYFFVRGFVIAFVSYVCGLLGLYDEGLDEIKVIEEMELDDERLPEMKENLLHMKQEAEEEDDDDEGIDEEEDGEAEAKKKTALSNSEAPTVEKLIVDGKVQPRLLEVLTEIFQNFDKNKDSALDGDELNAFHLVTNGTPMDATTLRFLRQHFECDKNRSLTLTGFLNFYVSQTIGDLEETLKDLKNLGYDTDLNRVVKEENFLNQSKK